MGGEPTFVSIDDMDGERVEHALRWARRNTGRLTGSSAGSATVLLPAGSCTTDRANGIPANRCRAGPWACIGARTASRSGANCRSWPTSSNRTTPRKRDAQAFCSHLARRLGVEPTHVMPGYEDVWYYLWKERRLPMNVDPLDSKLDQRRRAPAAARSLRTGARQGRGLRPAACGKDSEGGGGWESGPWFFRCERMYLVPGDSPMGYRLPLDSIPWVAPSDYPHIYRATPGKPAVRCRDREAARPRTRLRWPEHSVQTPCGR